MKSILFSILLFSALFSSNSALSKPEGSRQPDQIVELFRHGARGPVVDYDDSWPLSEYGMLTPIGLRQQYILGKVISEKYPDLVGSTYNYSQVYLLTDFTPRCIQSAGAHLYGIYLGTGPSLPENYPPELAIPPFKDPNVEKIADSLPDSEALPYNFVPGIIQVVDQANGYIFSGDQGVYCPNQDIWELQNGNDSLAQEAFVIFGETIANINKHLNESLQLTSATDIFLYGDTMLVDIYQNITLPGGITDPALITNMTWAFTWFTYHSWEGQQLQRELGAFNVIQVMLQQLESFRQGENFNTAAFFSGHDDNILAILAAFGVINEQCILDNFYSVLANGTLVHPACSYPFFASDLVFEFYNDTEAPYIQAYYNNLLIPICNGQDSCAYDDFVAFANSAGGNNTLESYFQKCGANSTYLDMIGVTNTISPSMVSIPKTRSIRTETVMIVGLSMMCVMLLVKMMMDKKKHEEQVKTARREHGLYSKLTTV